MSAVACQRRAHRPHRRGFTLVELLICVGIIALLLAILLPMLGKARAQAARAKCGCNLRQIGQAFHMYAGEFRGRAMPLAYWRTTPTEPFPTYWFGMTVPTGTDHTRGFLWPYLAMELRPESLYECPSQPPGTFEIMQAGGPTSTYGYNGYYLTPAFTPGYAWTIGRRPWQVIDAMPDPSRVFAFADTMIDWGGVLKNCALLDPPQLWSGSYWSDNPSPTTCFRHERRASAVFVDGHVEPIGPGDGRIASPEFHLGSAGATNDPRYVPDWRTWR